MTRLDVGPEQVCRARESAGPTVMVLEAREVPLGGLRAMSVRRTLPQRDLPMIGAWCFLDAMGPQEILMQLDPHPHTGLQTVTWPLVGEVRHRDSVGSDVVVRPGALNLMTSGRGISHSEYTPGASAAELFALQLWIALPEGARHGAPAFEQHADVPRVSGDGYEATVVMGSLDGVTSPATTYSPLVGAELRVSPGARVRLPLDPQWEHGVLVVSGDLQLDDVEAGAGPLLYLGTGREDVEFTSGNGAVLFLLGGEPFAEEIVMWWNFVGRSHDEIADAREDWEAGSERFGPVVAHGSERIPAPAMPGVRLTPRQRRLPTDG